MEKSPVITEFGQGLETLIHRALAQKSEELDTREKLVTEREKKVDHILKNVQTQGCVKLQVGSVFYDIAADVLLSNKESYFHGLLNPKFSQDKQVHFISRDGDIFKYVVEFLTYGKLISNLSPEEREKLTIDADFFLLPSLVEQIKKRPPMAATPTPKKLCLIKLFSSVQTAANSLIQWNSVEINGPTSHFTHNGACRITINETGLYEVHVRCGRNNASNGTYLALRKNGTDTAHSYQSDANSHYNSASLHEILSINKNEYLEVYNGGGTPTLGDGLSTKITVLFLE